MNTNQPPDCFELQDNLAAVVAPDGKITQLPKAPTLEEAQKLVGGYVEYIAIQSGKVDGQMLVNEDGLRMQLAPNRIATSLVRGYSMSSSGIVGPVIILTGKMRWT